MAKPRTISVDQANSFLSCYPELSEARAESSIKVDDWGLKRLAYLVKKREKGRYVFFDYAGVPELIHEMERQFKISEEVIKFLSIKLDQDLDLEAFKAEAEAKAAAEAAPAKATPVQPAEEAPIEEKPDVAVPEDTAAAETSADEIKTESGGSEIPTTESAEIKTEEPKKEVEP